MKQNTKKEKFLSILLNHVSSCGLTKLPLTDPFGFTVQSVKLSQINTENMVWVLKSNFFYDKRLLIKLLPHFEFECVSHLSNWLQGCLSDEEILSNSNLKKAIVQCVESNMEIIKDYSTQKYAFYKWLSNLLKSPQISSKEKDLFEDCRQKQSSYRLSKIKNITITIDEEHFINMSQDPADLQQCMDAQNWLQNLFLFISKNTQALKLLECENINTTKSNNPNYLQISFLGVSQEFFLDFLLKYIILNFQSIRSLIPDNRLSLEKSKQDYNSKVNSFLLKKKLDFNLTTTNNEDFTNKAHFKI